MSKKKRSDERTFETFKEVSRHDERIMTEAHPSCFNGQPNVVKYRVTIERVPEPDAVIRDRIEALWRSSKNWHDIAPLQKAAKRYGLDLDMKEYGVDKKGGS